MTTGSLMDKARPFQSIKAKSLVENSGKRLHVRQSLWIPARQRHCIQMKTHKAPAATGNYPMTTRVARPKIIPILWLKEWGGGGVKKSFWWHY
ncbi:hypothetical protein I79_008503 [Cricetulus griseus]|uniref:Uncharacterized protein n=1 Tax=Cricetulus griseus TaxID=10029 RepID=G3HDC2_CRIGR|nr:hypothetical protein I79_008503 [Cricetulus griseus]